MADSYDEKIDAMLAARQKRAAYQKIQRQKELQKQFAYLGVGIFVLLFVVVLLFKACSKDEKPVATKEKQTTMTEVISTTEAVEQDTTETESEEQTTTDGAPDVAGKTMYTTDVLNFRTEASVESDLIVHIPKGEAVTVLTNDGEWCNIRYNDQLGYVKLEYLSDDEPQ